MPDVKETSYYERTYRLPLDERRIMLFTIRNSPTKNWYVRIRKNKGSGYFQRSLKTDNLEVAKDKATKIYMEMWGVEEKGIEYSDACFSDTFKVFIDEAAFSKARKIRCRGIFVRYFSPYFKNIPLHKVDTAMFQKYLEWRVGYWSRMAESGELERLKETNEITHIAKKPSETTLKSEKQFFKQFLYWCEAKRLIDYVPALRVNMRTLLGTKMDTRRQKSKALTRDQQRRIERKLRTYCLQKGQEDNNIMRRFGRARLYYFVYWSYHTLIRPSTELTGVKWSDVKIRKSRKHKDQVIGLINVRDSKTGKPRVCVMPYSQVALITRWRQLTLELTKDSAQGSLGLDDDYVFPSWDGSRGKATQIGFLLRKKLNEWGERYTQDNKVVTMYSIARHTSITRRIEDSGWSVGQIATLAGTSIFQISHFYYEAFVNANPDKFANTFNPAEGDGKIEDYKIQRIQDALEDLDWDVV
jgi:hypothetical protein